ncbi:CHAP domain-containing protein [Candidatus Sumerlaeota bacterium]|nr:CHAP domain-containing protein [Candidatus Sumerlaeota bacterium]
MGAQPPRSKPELFYPILLLSGIFFVSGASALRQPPPDFGERLGDFNGVVLYSNGQAKPKYSGSEKCEVDGYVTGYKWQCVEYVVRYYKQVYGLEIRGGHARDWFGLAGEKNLLQFANGGTTPPEVGDILCSNSGGWGHVAIIREVGPDYIIVIHQNWKNTADDLARRCPMESRDGHWFVKSFPAAPAYKWQGWLRKN